VRAVLWALALFAVAASAALFAGSNPGAVTVYWDTTRLDLSLNLALMVLLVAFVVLHLALRALAALGSIPQQARRWRLLQKERALQAALLDGLAHLLGGRFIRARKSAELVLALEDSVQQSGEKLPYAARLRALAQLLAAESAHALQDRSMRDMHLQMALVQAGAREAQEMRDGMQLRAARWAFDDRDAAAAVEWLDQLPQGAARRTVALRLRFKAARLAGRSRNALEMARLLTKHRAFSEAAGKSIARGLALEMLRGAHDPRQVHQAWELLDVAEQQMPDIAMEAAQRLLDVGGEAVQSRQWLLPVWDALRGVSPTDGLAPRVRMVRILEQGFDSPGGAPDAAWLARIEALQMANPGDPVLQYLAGRVCMRLQLWGKAQQLLKQAAGLLRDPTLKRDAWRALGDMAQHRQDDAAAAQAYREALKA